MTSASSGFEKIAEQELHRGRVIRLVATQFRGPGGESFSRDVVRSPGAVGIVAVEEGPRGPEAVLVRQYRAPIEGFLLEIPAGLRDKPGEAPEETAQRELAEEVGLRAGRLEHLVTFLNAAGMTDQRTFVYLATGLDAVDQAADGVEEQYMTVERVLLTDVPELIAAGVLADAKTLIGLSMAAARYRAT
ncbi:MAG: NUDIX domain-containing protein [Acidimicrobiales bacterium]